MSFEKQISDFDREYRKLESRFNEINKDIANVLRAQLEEIKPLVNQIRSKGFYFSHPQLNNLRTTVGAIVGRNALDQSELYVYDGEVNQIFQVKASHPNEKSKASALPIEEFVIFADLEFAFAGIKYVRERLLQDINKEFERDVEKRQSLFYRITGA